MAIADAFRLSPEPVFDERGSFYEEFRLSELCEATGHRFNLAQANSSVSRAGTLRGIHGTVIPPGQQKIVTCVRGAALDVVVDMRVGSPTFGVADITSLDEDSGAAVYIADGLGHAFLALRDGTCISYLLSVCHVPGTMIEVNPFDPALRLPWRPEDSLIISEKDAKAITLAQAAEEGLLANYDDCLAHYASLRAS
jgi:NDP-hexose 3,5-(Or5-) epimerase